MIDNFYKEPEAIGYVPVRYFRNLSEVVYNKEGHKDSVVQHCYAKFFGDFISQIKLNILHGKPFYLSRFSQFLNFSDPDDLNFEKLQQKLRRLQQRFSKTQPFVLSLAKLEINQSVNHSAQPFYVSPYTPAFREYGLKPIKEKYKKNYSEYEVRHMLYDLFCRMNLSIRMSYINKIIEANKSKYPFIKNNEIGSSIILQGLIDNKCLFFIGDMQYVDSVLDETSHKKRLILNIDRGSIDEDRLKLSNFFIKKRLNESIQETRIVLIPLSPDDDFTKYSFYTSDLEDKYHFIEEIIKYLSDKKIIFSRDELSYIQKNSQNIYSDVVENSTAFWIYENQHAFKHPSSHQIIGGNFIDPTNLNVFAL